MERGDQSGSKSKEKLGTACLNRLYGPTYDSEVDELRNNVLMVRIWRDKIKGKVDKRPSEVAQWSIAVHKAVDCFSRAEKAMEEASHLIQNGIKAKEKQQQLMSRRDFSREAKRKRYELVRMQKELESLQADLKAEKVGQRNSTPGEKGHTAHQAQSSVRPKGAEYVPLPSQEEVVGEILQAYRSGHEVVVLWGPEGVGKTSLAKKVCESATVTQRDSSPPPFAAGLMVQATRDSHYGVIRAEIDFELLKNLGRYKAAACGKPTSAQATSGDDEDILVIIDDFFHLVDQDDSSSFNLEDIGPPPPGYKFKLLLISTSRIHTWKSIELRALPVLEGETLFSKVAGEEHSYELATLVARESGGLPFTIVFAASTAEFLASTGPKAPDDHDHPAFIDYLYKNKSLFNDPVSLLQPLFPPELMRLLVLAGQLANDGGPQVSILDLAFHDKGVQEIANQDAEKAIKETRKNVDKLVNCSLLHPGKFDGFVQVHDIVRSSSLTYNQESNELKDMNIQCNELKHLHEGLH